MMTYFVSPFFMTSKETTWTQLWLFILATTSESYTYYMLGYLVKRSVTTCLSGTTFVMWTIGLKYFCDSLFHIVHCQPRKGTP